jgi:Tfp pilus assembly protein PilV
MRGLWWSSLAIAGLASATYNHSSSSSSRHMLSSSSRHISSSSSRRISSTPSPVPTPAPSDVYDTYPTGGGYGTSSTPNTCQKETVISISKTTETCTVTTTSVSTSTEWKTTTATSTTTSVSTCFETTVRFIPLRTFGRVRYFHGVDLGLRDECAHLDPSSAGELFGRHCGPLKMSRLWRGLD